jgi:hypothetical protein
LHERGQLRVDRPFRRDGQLLEEQGVAAARAVELRELLCVDTRPHELGGLGDREPSEVQPLGAVAPSRLRQRGEEPLIGLGRTRREHDQNLALDIAVQEMADGL